MFARGEFSMVRSQAGIEAYTQFRFYNRLFWLGLLGIVAFPLMSIVVAAVVYQITKNSNLSAAHQLAQALRAV